MSSFLERVHIKRSYSAPLPTDHEAPSPRSLQIALEQIANSNLSSPSLLHSSRFSPAATSDDSIEDFKNLAESSIENLDAYALKKIPRKHLSNYTVLVADLREDYSKLVQIISDAKKAAHDSERQDLDIVKNFPSAESQEESRLREILAANRLTEPLQQILQTAGWSVSDLNELRFSEDENEFRMSFAFRIIEQREFDLFKHLPLETLEIISHEIIRRKEVYEEMHDYIAIGLQ